jgi:hypothetical protein
MNRLQRMTELSRRLAAAGNADDWDEVAAVDRELAAGLGCWSQPVRWSLAERTALAELREVHDDVQAQCADEARRHQGQLAALRAHREGWMAYGLQEHAQAPVHTAVDETDATPAPARPQASAAAPAPMSTDAPAIARFERRTP